eukprot:8010279-Pyramimonas_sp.AAC.1
MHTVALGVMGFVVSALMWRLHGSEAYSGGFEEKGQRDAAAADRIRNDLAQWYSSQRALGRPQEETDAFTIN